jgi:hypothetical protein
VGGSGDVEGQEAYSSDLGRLLRLDAERRGEHGSKASDERAAIHSIT